MKKKIKQKVKEPRKIKNIIKKPAPPLFLFIDIKGENEDIDKIKSFLIQRKDNTSIGVLKTSESLSDGLKEEFGEKLMVYESQREFFENNQKGYCILIDQQSRYEEVAELINWYNTNWKELKDGTLAYVSIENENAVLNKFLKFWIDFILGVKSKFYPSGLKLFSLQNAGHFASLLGQFHPLKSLAALRDYLPDQIEVPVKLKSKVLPKGISLKVILFYFSLIFEKFIVSPFQELKAEKATSQLKRGNSGLYRLSFFLISAIGFVLLPALSFDYGMTWDEPVLVEYAKDIRSFYASGGENRDVFDMTKHARNATLHYSASFDFLAELLHDYFSPFEGIYETRHFLNALFGAIAILFIGRIAREAGSWRTAVFAGVFMILSPRYFGHSMNNPKDIPFLLGYALSIFFIVRFCWQFPKPKPGTIFWLIFSLAFIISIKIGGLLAVGLFGLFTGATWLVYANQNTLGIAMKLIPRYAIYILFIVLASYLLGIWFWPWGYDKPFENPMISLQEFTNFRFLITYELFEGERINMDNPPWYYIFKWIGISVPLFVLIGFFIGLLPIPNKLKKYNTAVLLMLVFSFFFPIIYTIVKNSTLYSGWRHLMFVYAPFVVIAAVGWDYLVQLTDKKAVSYGVVVVLIALMAKPAFWMVKNHPNQYVYFNEAVGGINGAYKEYETEYWCNSMKQAAEWLIENEPVNQKKSRVAANFEIQTAQYYANKHTDSLQMIWTRENEKFRKDWDYAFFGTRGMPTELIEASFPPKGTIHVIKADTVPLLAIVKRENRYLPDAFKLRGQGKAVQALELAEKAVEYEPNNVEALRLVGMLQIDLNKSDEAIKTLSKVIRLNPDDFVSYTLVGIAYNQKKQYSDAIKLFNKSIQLKVNNTSGYLNRGRSYMAMKEFDSAIKSFQKAAEYDNGKNPRIFVDMGMAFFQKGLQLPNSKNQYFQMGIRNLQVALQIRPNMPDVFRTLSYAYKEIGDELNAKKYADML
ncbi:tetratricopeptide repeat protein [Flexithrix dorotheae]|uniref:tetratricopeptide repeat protein n=1 Tax=Flexithrix dorotheae TaxID=70993 RepID=UPI0003650E45|nr:tetratricopeptide repeat protein [Flexithrix dorotheae]